MLKIWIYTIVALGMISFSTFSGFSISISKDGGSANAQAGISNFTDAKISVFPWYHSNSGKVTSIRVLDVTPLARSEVSFTESGTVIGIGNVTNQGTFLETYRSEKMISGQGKGIITTRNGDIIRWTSYDSGLINSDKTERYHGIMFFEASIGKLTYLNNAVGLYTTDVGNNGSSLRQIWLWK